MRTRAPKLRCASGRKPKPAAPIGVRRHEAQVHSRYVEEKQRRLASDDGRGALSGASYVISAAPQIEQIHSGRERLRWRGSDKCCAVRWKGC